MKTMKLTKTQLKQIIKEEVQKLLNESSHEYNIGDKVEYLGYPAEVKGISDKLGKKLYHIKYLKQGVGLIALKFVNPNNLKSLNEGIIKNLTLAALLALPGLANASVPPSVEKDKIVNVVSQNNQLNFNNIESFKKYFNDNIDHFKTIRTTREAPLKVVIDNIIYDGYLGRSKDMGLSINKAKIGIGISPTYQIPIKVGNEYVSIVLFKQQ
jgi:hypothetical protein